MRKLHAGEGTERERSVSMPIAIRKLREHHAHIVLDRSDLEALVALAHAEEPAEAERCAARLRALLGAERNELEPLIGALVDRAAELDSARRLARTDALTGVANRRALSEALRRELARAKRSDKPLALLMFDLDGFKAINDRYSHAAGDRALRVVAHCAERVTRDGDLVARIGGDEFAVVLPETGLRGAREIGERIRAQLARASENGPALEISYGLATASDPHTSPSTLLADADRELLRDKAVRRSLRPGLSAR